MLYLNVSLDVCIHPLEIVRWTLICQQTVPACASTAKQLRLSQVKELTEFVDGE